MKNMRIGSISLGVLTILSLVGCSSGEDQTASTANSSSSTQFEASNDVAPGGGSAKPPVGSALGAPAPEVATATSSPAVVDGIGGAEPSIAKNRK